jgi:UDP-perosamine 4-acetyltransferase
MSAGAVTANYLKPLVIVGAGGHAKVVIEIVRSLALYQIVGLLAADRTPRTVLDEPVIGSDADLPSLLRVGVTAAFVAIGDNRTRQKVAARVRAEGFSLINAISPAATVSPTARLGQGIAIMPGAVINAAARIDDLAIVNTGACVDHDCQVGEAAHVGPRSVLAGNVKVGKLSFLGAGSAVIPNTMIGQAALIGAGACVVRDIPDHAVAIGVPARVIRYHEQSGKDSH